MTARQHPARADVAEIDAQIAPFADAAARLNEIPGVGLFAAHTIIAGIGLDMNRFPAAGHLCSWAKPSLPEGIRRQEERLELHWPRQPPPGRVLGEAAVAASKTSTFPGRALPPHRPLPRQEQSSRRGQPLHPGHRLAPAI
jgi:hypothetical protein